MTAVIPPLLTLREVADRFQWSTRTLKQKLADHGIGTIGRGRLARLTEADVLRLIEAERQPTRHPPAIDPALVWARDPVCGRRGVQPLPLNPTLGDKIRYGKARARRIREQIEREDLQRRRRD